MDRSRVTRYLSVYFTVLGGLLAVLAPVTYFLRKPSDALDLVLLAVFFIIGVFYIWRGRKLATAKPVA